jgi:hypothetical protein
MAAHKPWPQFIAVTLAILLVAACGEPATEPARAPTALPPAATAVPPTATPVLPTAPAPVPTEGAAAGGRLQPLASAACRDLAGAMSETLGIAGETAEAPFEDPLSGETGAGCRTTITASGRQFESAVPLTGGAAQVLVSLGWEPDARYAAGGPGASLAGYRRAGALCLLAVTSEPAEGAQCGSDEPFLACWERLAPEQRAYRATLDCVQGASAAPPQPEPEAVRIQFAPGATSAEVQGRLAPGAVDRYVLAAVARQEMTVKLSTTSGEVAAILAIWGADGTVLISDHADATTWQERLPLTQDYYIDVRSVVQETVDYTLAVSIPPAAGGFSPIAQCAFAGSGATLSFASQRLNFTCPPEGDREVGLLGDVVPGEQGWAMEKVVLVHTDSGFAIESSARVLITHIDLADGTRCAFGGTGAGLAFGGRRLAFTCPPQGEHEAGLLGTPVAGEAGWEIEKVMIVHTDAGWSLQSSEIVPIAALTVRPAATP